jgi:hypothetical protein
MHIYLAKHPVKDIYQNAFKIVSREHLNELGKDLNLVQYIEQSSLKPFWRKHTR